MLDTLSLKMSQTKCAFTQFLYSNIYFLTLTFLALNYMSHILFNMATKVKSTFVKTFCSHHYTASLFHFVSLLHFKH